MNTFGKIGNAVLIRALGLQKNYTEVVDTTIEIIDEELSGCSSCYYGQIKAAFSSNKELYQMALSQCESCPHKCMKKETIYKKIYHNEKNQYGYQPRLKINAIKLLLAYHMMDINQNGIIFSVNTKDLAKLLGCDIKTIRSNNALLSSYGYISYSKTDTFFINVLLPSYEDYFKPASMGGRGFLVLSTEVFQKILSITSLNEMRLSLRQLMEFDRLSSKGITEIKKSYKELKHLLPDYCKRNTIKKAVNGMELFHVVLSEYGISFEIKDAFNSKKVKEESKQLYQTAITDFKRLFNRDVVQINTGKLSITDSTFEEFFSCNRGDERNYPLLILSNTNILDLAGLCLEYSYGQVVQALQTVYETYYIKQNEPTNLGGLVRSLILANSYHEAA